jgi:hypothetical protein
MHGVALIHLIHFAGKRMMAQGIDGLSQGVMTQGVMRGSPLEDFVPLHLDPLARQGPSLAKWVNSWSGVLENLRWVSPEDWFFRAHHEKLCVWNFAPAAAQTAFEQLGKIQHTRPSHTHLS